MNSTKQMRLKCSHPATMREVSKTTSVVQTHRSQGKPASADDHKGKLAHTDDQKDTGSAPKVFIQRKPRDASQTWKKEKHETKWTKDNTRPCRSHLAFFQDKSHPSREKLEPAKSPDCKDRVLPNLLLLALLKSQKINNLNLNNTENPACANRRWISQSPVTKLHYQKGIPKQIIP